MTSSINKFYSEFTTKKDVASFIKFFSVVTWEKIGFVRRQHGLKFHEVTVTQNLLFQFRLMSGMYPNSVQMFEAINEKANGNDVELFIKFKEGYIFFPCQAKIAYKGADGTYTSIDHHVKDKLTGQQVQQIENLIAYAEKPYERGIAIYTFYNFSEDSDVTSKIALSCTDDKEVYGCSFATAKQLKHHHFKNGGWNKPIPSFSSLHPSLAMPFYKLFNLLGKSIFDLQSIGVSLADVGDLRKYNRFDLPDASRWEAIDVTELREPRTTVDKKVLGGDDRVRPGFNPKYRVVISSAEIDTELAKWLFL